MENNYVFENNLVFTDAISIVNKGKQLSLLLKRDEQDSKLLVSMYIYLRKGIDLSPEINSARITDKYNFDRCVNIAVNYFNSFI